MWRFAKHNISNICWLRIRIFIGFHSNRVYRGSPQHQKTNLQQIYTYSYIYSAQVCSVCLVCRIIGSFSILHIQSDQIKYIANNAKSVSIAHRSEFLKVFGTKRWCTCSYFHFINHIYTTPNCVPYNEVEVHSFHYRDKTWALSRLKSLETRLFDQEYVRRS